MQLYHIDCEGILEYINDLEDMQAKSERKKKRSPTRCLSSSRKIQCSARRNYLRPTRTRRNLTSTRKCGHGGKKLIVRRRKKRQLKRKPPTGRTNLGRRTAQHPHRRKTLWEKINHWACNTSPDILAISRRRQRRRSPYWRS